jgi:cytochrome o ubiquinol oxidase operon protein cyoD
MSSDIKHFSFKTYFLAFIFFICLTLTSYFAVTEHLLKGSSLLVLIVACGFVQAVVQLGIFLDLILEEKPRSNLHIFGFMVLILTIVIAGTLWIMYSLNERTMMGGM